MKIKLKSLQGNYNKVGCLPPSPPKGCPEIYPGRVTPKVLKGENLYYVAFSDGVKRFYTNKDGSAEYGNTGILDPNCVTYINLFINGMLQPTALYQVKKGVLILRSQDIPIEGVPIILQFVKIYGS